MAVGTLYMPLCGVNGRNHDFGTRQNGSGGISNNAP